MNNKINYKPSYGIRKRYNTDGVIEYYYPITNKVIEPTKVEKLVSIENQIESLKNTVNIFPLPMLPTINTIVNTLEFIFIQIDPNYVIEEDEEDIDDPDTVLTWPEEPTESIPDEDTFLYSDVVPNVIVKSLPLDKIKLINKTYCGTLLEITKDYLKTLKESTSQYYIDLMNISGETEKHNIHFATKKYNQGSSNLNNKDLQHMSDYVIKSQVIRDQKERMMRKLINEDESLCKITACEVARELSLRYEQEVFRNNNEVSDLFNNIILKESRLQYEKKLENNLYELYKYLNSSVILLDECLRLYIREARAKNILIKQGDLKI